MEESNIYLTSPWDLKSDKIFLAERTNIHFVFNKENVKRKISVMLLQRDKKDVIEISGGDSITIEPRASNMIWIYPKDF